MDNFVLLNQVISSMYEDNLNRAQEAVLAGESHGNPVNLAEEWTQLELLDAVNEFFKVKP